MEKRLLSAINDMIADLEKELRQQIKSRHYPGVTPETAKHELYGFKLALKELGIIAKEDCYVLPNAFGKQDQATSCQHVDSEGHPVKVAIAGIAIDPHDYVLEEEVAGCTVRVLRCKKCGHVVVGWKRDGGSERIDEI